MKKLINTAFIYAIVGMVAGVFYREFTKIIGFTGLSNLSVLHTHVFVLGMIMFLIVAALSTQLDIVNHEKFSKFYKTYNLGLILTTTMLFARGMTQALEMDLSKGLNASISGISGLAHIILAAGIMYLFTILRDLAQD